MTHPDRPSVADELLRELERLLTSIGEMDYTLRGVKIYKTPAHLKCELDFDSLRVAGLQDSLPGS
ncbi:MAG: hypothetical protein HY608_09895 [Planctomycetes bacterium]|nr:hypothetical protein [Planctomycetota bacterium]